MATTVGVLVLAAGVLSGCDPKPRADLTVTSPADAPDLSPGDGTCATQAGVCTLRAAIEETNAAPTDDIVRIAPGVEPSLGGVAAPITDDLEILGGGATLSDRIVHSGGVLTIRDLTITGVTTPSGCGGAINSTGGSLVLHRAVVRGNATAGNHGGGICTSSPLVVLDSSIAGNRVTGTGAPTGGGIRTSSSLTLVRSTVYGNSTVSGPGHAVSVIGPGPLTIMSSTITGNGQTPFSTAVDVLAPTASGRITAATISDSIDIPATVAVEGTILTQCSGSSTPTSEGFNVLPPSCGAAHPTDIATNLASTGGVEPLAGSGGPTPTMLLGAASILRDVVPVGTPRLCDGSSPIDQRALPRPAHGACDVGAVEVQSSLRAGPAVPLDGQPQVMGQVAAVNDDGIAVGTAPSAFTGTWPPPDMAVRWDGAGARTTLGGPGSRALDVNDDGIAVGSVLAAGAERAAMWQTDGTLVDLGTLPGDTSSKASHVTDGGIVLGGSTGPGGTRAWRWDPAAPGMVALPALGGTETRVTTATETTALGSAQLGDGSMRQVLWDLTTSDVTPLDVPSADGATDVQVTGLAADGTLVGWGTFPDLGDHCTSGFPPSYGFEPCPDTRALVWESADAPPQMIPGRRPLERAIGINEAGLVLIAEYRYVESCSWCPWSDDGVSVLDTATGERFALPGQPATSVTDSGVVGVNEYFSPGYGEIYLQASTVRLTR